MPVAACGTPSHRRRGWFRRLPDHRPEASAAVPSRVQDRSAWRCRRGAVVADRPGVADGGALQLDFPIPRLTVRTDEHVDGSGDGGILSIVGEVGFERCPRGEVAGVVRAARGTGERVLAGSTAHVGRSAVQVIEVGGGCNCAHLSHECACGEGTVVRRLADPPAIRGITGVLRVHDAGFRVGRA